MPSYTCTFVTNMCEHEQKYIYSYSYSCVLYSIHWMRNGICAKTHVQYTLDEEWNMREYSLMYIVQYALDEEWNMRATAHWMRTDNAE